MTLFGFIEATFASWLILACLGGSAWALVASTAKRRNGAVIVRRPIYPPPVPAPATPAATTQPFWTNPFDGLPVEILSDDAVRSLFDDIIAGEFSGGER